MSNSFGPWATSIDAGGNPELSAFWRRRLTRLAAASQASPVLSRRQWLCLGATLVLVMLLPSFRLAPAVADEKKPPEKHTYNFTTTVSKEGVGKEGESTKKPTAAQTKHMVPAPWVLPNGMQMWFCSTGGGEPAVAPEIKTLIAKKQYTFIRMFESPGGDTQYEYRFVLADGRETKLTVLTRLENVASWDEYLRKRDEQSRKRQETIRQALAAGRFRLINVEPLQVHLCRDKDTHQRFKIGRVAGRDGIDKAVTMPDSGPLPKSMTDGTWPEHLRAIREGKRELLGLQAVSSYTYEMTGDDGTKVLFNYGGDGGPLSDPEKKGR
jgi:hypothetical protein